MVKRISTGITRRSLLGGVACAAIVGRAEAQMVLRPPASGTDSRYVKYSQAGPFGGGDNAKVITIPDLGIRAAVHVPRAREARMVVFSHGALADPQIYRPLLAQWASHGFGVVAPIHDDSVIEKGLSARREDPHTGTTWDVKGLLGDGEAWELRANMCSDVLNTAETLSRLTGVRLLTDRPIIVGHDHGAYIAQLLLGAVADGEKGRVTKATDKRFVGGMLLSPQGAGVMGLGKASWAGADRPTLSVLAGKEIDSMGEDVPRKRSAFELAPPDYKHLAIEKNAGAQLFTGQRSLINETERMMFDDLKAITTAFLMAYSGRDEQAFKDLYGDWFGIATSQRMSIESR